MRKVFSLFLLLIIILASMPAMAKMKKLGQAGMTFLSVGGSARATGMAEAYNFVKNDLSSVFYNPAGLASVQNRAFYFNYTDWIADMSVANAAVAWNTGQYGVFSLHTQMMNYGDFNGTAISESDPRGYTDVEVGDVSGLSLGIGYGYQMTDKFAIGGSIKYVHQKLGNNDTYMGDAIEETGKQNKIGTVAFDFGTIYETGIKSVVLAMSIRNYSSQQLYENEEFGIPQTYKIGVSANLFELLPLSVGSDHSAVLALEGVDVVDRPEYMNYGLEYTYIEKFSVRGGWSMQRREDGIGGLSLGAGVKLGSVGTNGRLDVSYSDFGSVMGSVMRVSIGGSF
jgi:hypothetical protein